MNKETHPFDPAYSEGREGKCIDCGHPARHPSHQKTFDLIGHLHRQKEWSEETFGPGPRTHGVLDHIQKEIGEVRADPTDLEEWIDLVLLSLDGAWRAGHSPEKIVSALDAKQTKNESRSWPDWRTVPTDKAIEHNRESPNKKFYNRVEVLKEALRELKHSRHHCWCQMAIGNPMIKEHSSGCLKAQVLLSVEGE